MSELRKPSGYRPDIDGLRCIAILAVILFHAGIPFITGGFVGVDVFFVISGYLIGSHIYRETQAGQFSLSRFYQRRAKRILPAFFFVLTTSYVLGCFLLSATELRRFAAQSIAAIASCSNFYFWLKAGYFAPKADANPLLMTWSLGVEEQFYIFFPLMMILLRKLRPRPLLAVLSLVAAVSFLLAVMGVSRYPTATFYLLPSRAWEIGAGCILGIYEVFSPGRPVTPRALVASEVMAVVGLVGIVGCSLLYTPQIPFPGLAALPAVFGAVILIRTRESWVNRWLLSAKPLTLVGLISYSWYLWHWPLLSFAHICTGGPLSAWAACAVILFSLGLSIVSYFVVEQPLRHTKKSGAPLLIGYGIACVLFAVPAVVAYAAHGLPGRYPAATAVESAAAIGFPDTCLVTYGASGLATAAHCLPSHSGKPVLALMGDSHAAALAYALRSEGAARGWAVDDLTKSSCPQLGEVTRAMVAHPFHARECAAYNAAALERVARDPAIHTVLLAGYWTAGFPVSRGDGYVHVGESATGADSQSWANLEAGLEATVRQLRSAGKQVVIATDVPRFAADPLMLTVGRAMPVRRWLGKLLSGRWTYSGTEPRGRTETATDEAADRMIAAVAARTGARVLDLSDGLCGGGACTFARDGRSYYVDEQHLSAAGAHAALGQAGLF